MYQKQNVIQTSNGFLKQGTVVEILSANEKYTEVVIGLDEGCVLIAKSLFLDTIKHNINITNNQSNLNISSTFPSFQHPPTHIELGQFTSLNDHQSSIVNSISLAYCQQNFENIQEIKNKLAFLISYFEIKQKHTKYLTKQIHKIIQEKNAFKKLLKDKCNGYLKESNALGMLGNLNLGSNAGNSINSMSNMLMTGSGTIIQPQLPTNPNTNFILQQFKLKMIFKQIQSEATSIIKKIPLFQLLEYIYHSWNKKQFLKKQKLDKFIEDDLLISMNGTFLKIPTVEESKEMIKKIQNKTIITVPPKLNSLPSVFYPNERIQYIYQRILSNNIKPLKSNISQTQLQVNSQSIYHSISLLLANDLSICVHPFDTDKYYSLYTLSTLPDKKTIQTYNSLFKGENIFEYLKNFDKYARIKQKDLDQRVKYFLLNKVIKEVVIYIEKLETIKEKRGGLFGIGKGYVSQIKEAKGKEKSMYNIGGYKSNETKNYDKNNQKEYVNNSNSSSSTFINFAKNNNGNINLTNTKSSQAQKKISINRPINQEYNKHNPNKTVNNNLNNNSNTLSYQKSLLIQQILNRYITKPQQMNFIINKCRQKNIKVFQLINYVKHNSDSWKFIFMEN